MVFSEDVNFSNSVFTKDFTSLNGLQGFHDPSLKLKNRCIFIIFFRKLKINTINLQRYKEELKSSFLNFTEITFEIENVIAQQ